MTEREPNRKDSNFSKEDRQNVADFFKRNKLIRYPANVATRISLYIITLSTQEGRELLKNPETRLFLFDREARVGLLEDSIFSNDLFFPNKEGTSLDHETAVAGRYVGYDFRRPTEFGKKVKEKGRNMVNDARLFSIPLTEIIDNPRDKYTPTSLLDIYTLEDMLLFQPATIDDLFEYGFVSQTTYKEAYDRVGLYNKFKSFIELGQIADKPVYQVTPKGNTLVILSKDFGVKQKDPKSKRVLVPAFG